MKTTALKVIASLLAGSAGSAVAASSSASAELAGNGMLLWFFIGFGVMVVLFQAAPAIVMFASMMKGLFSSNPAEAIFSPFKGKAEK